MKSFDLARQAWHWLWDPDDDTGLFFLFGLSVGFVLGMAVMATTWFYVTVGGARITQ